MDAQTPQTSGCGNIDAAPGVLGDRATGFAARLDAWVAEARVDRSADERAREQWLRRAAEADATLSGVLLDLAERGVGVAVATSTGRRWQGVVDGYRADFVALRIGLGLPVLVATEAITSVRTAPSVEATAGERVVTTDLRLADVLAELAGERSAVRLVTLDGREAVSGDLRSVGQDVVTVRGDSDAPGTAYVRIAAIAEVVVR